VNLKKYDKVISKYDPQEKKPSLKERLFKPFRTPRFGIFYRMRSYSKEKLNRLNNVSFATWFLILIVVLVFTILVANKMRYEHWKNLLIRIHPEIIVVPSGPDGKPLQISPVDKIVSEFEGSINAGLFVIFIVHLRTFLKGIWGNWNPRKVQVFSDHK
jgi:hypothetical protein